MEGTQSINISKRYHLLLMLDLISRLNLNSLMHSLQN